ncbi:MAG: Ig domain-containing protein, partial [Vicinamibacterales bacterium]
MQLEASGGTEPYLWSIVAGELPPGLSLNPDTGEISGVPTTPGIYEVTIALTDSSDPARSTSQWYKFLAVRGYAMEDVPFDPANARDGGTDLRITEADEYRQVDLPFIFTFYDEEFTYIQVSSYGYITFGDQPADSFQNTPIPDRAAPNGFAAPFWTFLESEIGAGVFYRVDGEAPNRRLVITWADTPHLPETGPGTISLILEEGTNAIIFQYPDVVFDEEGIEWTSFNYGNSSTIGIENPAGTAGVQFSHNDPSLEEYHGQKGIRFRPLSSGPRPPAITTLPVTEAVINQPYVYHPGAYSEGTQSWQLLSGPVGMAIDSAAGTLTWTPETLGAYDVTLQVSDENGSDMQEYQLNVQIGPTQEIVLAPVEGWDSYDGVPLTEARIGDLLESDDTWLFVRPESWVSL